MIKRHLTIAVDFDGTVVEHNYPAIGKPIPFALETLRLLQKDNHKLILWTCRAGKELENAVEYCEKGGVQFYAVNKNYPEEEFSENISRKIDADVYIDDRNINGLVQWGETYQTISGKAAQKKKKKAAWWSF